MDETSQRILREVEEGNGSKELWIGYRGFGSTDGGDFSSLGTFVGQNTHLTKLVFDLRGTASWVDSLDVRNRLFYDGLKQNSSIHELNLYFYNLPIVDGVGRKILDVYQEENNNLTILHISVANLQNEGENVIATTLRNNASLKRIDLHCCNIPDEQLLPMVDAVREHRSLEKLYLIGNRIGNAGCEAIATLLRDPNSNINHIDLSGNLIHNEGATALANGLTNNTKLRELNLTSNPIDQRAVDIFHKLLCSTSNINKTYHSNHTLERLTPAFLVGHLDSILKMNKCTNKSHVAIKKVLKFHPNIDMEPFFEWNMEGEGERNLKALPYIIAWFDRAREAVGSDERRESYNIDERKLSVIYQFSKAMPLLFVPNLHAKGGMNKRKRDD